MKSSRGRSSSRGKIQRRNAEDCDRLCALAIAKKISRIEREIQGIFWTDWVGEESSAMPGGDPAELLESRPAGVNRGADVSDAARCDADEFLRGSGNEPDPARAE